MVAGEVHFAFSRFRLSYSIGRKGEIAKRRNREVENEKSVSRFRVFDFAISRFRHIEYVRRKRLSAKTQTGINLPP